MTGRAFYFIAGSLGYLPSILVFVETPAGPSSPFMSRPWGNINSYVFHHHLYANNSSYFQSRSSLPISDQLALRYLP